MRIINKKIFIKKTNWICEANQHNYKVILDILKEAGYKWFSSTNREDYDFIKEYLDKKNKIWIINNDGGKGDKWLNLFFTERFYIQELERRKLIKL